MSTTISVGSDLRDWSIDLETLDNRYSSAILSIGMVQFNRDTGQIGVRHYAEISIDTAIKAGTVSGSTLAWWVGQGDKAKRVFAGKEKTPLACALADLATLIRGKTIGPRVWGNGSSFDITILEHAFHNGAHGLAVPWQYWDVRDMRTIMDAADVDTRKLPRNGVHHNALDDAEFQALAISVAWRRVKAAMGVQLPKWCGPAGFEGVNFGSTAAAPPASEPAATKSSKASPPPAAPTTLDDDDEL